MQKNNHWWKEQPNNFVYKEMCEESWWRLWPECGGEYRSIIRCQARTRYGGTAESWNCRGHVREATMEPNMLRVNCFHLVCHPPTAPRGSSGIVEFTVNCRLCLLNVCQPHDYVFLLLSKMWWKLRMQVLVNTCAHNIEQIVVSLSTSTIRSS